MRFGLTQTGNKLKDAYHNPLDQQYVTLGISLPILDWGRGKGQVRVARSNRDLTYTQVEQDKTDFELNVRKLVKQFNLQSQRVHIAARTDETAQRRADVADDFISWESLPYSTSMLPSVKKMPPDEITSLHYITTGVYTTLSAVSHFMILK